MKNPHKLSSRIVEVLEISNKNSINPERNLFFSYQGDEMDKITIFFH